MTGSVSVQLKHASKTGKSCDVTDCTNRFNRKLELYFESTAESYRKRQIKKSLQFTETTRTQAAKHGFAVTIMSRIVFLGVKIIPQKLYTQIFHFHLYIENIIHNNQTGGGW